MCLEKCLINDFLCSVTVNVCLTPSTMESASQEKLTPCLQTTLHPAWLRILSPLFPLKQNIWLLLKLKHIYSPPALKLPMGKALKSFRNMEYKQGRDGKTSSRETTPCYAMGLVGARLN